MDDLRIKLLRNRKNEEQISHRPHWDRSLDQVEFTVDSRFEFVEELEEEDSYFAQRNTHQVHDLREKLHTSHSKIPQNFGNFEVQNGRRNNHTRRERSYRSRNWFDSQRPYENPEDLRRHLNQRQLQNYENYERPYRDDYMPLEHETDGHFFREDMYYDQEYLDDVERYESRMLEDHVQDQNEVYEYDERRLSYERRQYQDQIDDNEGRRYESRIFEDHEQNEYEDYQQANYQPQQHDEYGYHSRQKMERRSSYERNNYYPQKRDQYQDHQESNRHRQERLYNEHHPENRYENNPPLQKEYAREKYDQKSLEDRHQDQNYDESYNDFNRYENNLRSKERYIRKEFDQRRSQEQIRYEERRENYQHYPYQQESYNDYHETDQRPIEPVQQPQSKGHFGLKMGSVHPAGPSSENGNKGPIVLSGADPFAPNVEPQPMEIDIPLPTPSGRSSNRRTTENHESKRKRERREKNTNNHQNNKFQDFMREKNQQQLDDVRDENNHKKSKKRSLSPKDDPNKTKSSRRRNSHERRSSQSPDYTQRRRSRSRSRDRVLRRSLSPQQRPSKRFLSPTQRYDQTFYDKPGPSRRRSPSPFKDRTQMNRNSPSSPPSRGREDQSPEIEILHIPLKIPKNLSPPPPPNIGSDNHPTIKRNHNRKMNGRIENGIEVIDVEDDSGRTERDCSNARGQYKGQKHTSSVKSMVTIDYHHLKVSITGSGFSDHTTDFILQDPESSSDPLSRPTRSFLSFLEEKLISKSRGVQLANEMIHTWRYVMSILLYFLSVYGLN